MDAEAYFSRGLAYYDKAGRDQVIVDYVQAIADLEKALDLGLSPDAEKYAEELLEKMGRK
jgi:hypothetical protein